MKIFKTITAIILATSIFTACESGGSSDNELKEKSPEELKQELKSREQSNPVEYLDISFNLRMNLLGEDVIEGYIFNNATMATFKDVQLHIRYYSKTKTLINSEKQVLYEYLAPRSKKEFKIKTYSPKGTKTIGIDVIDGTAVYQ